MNHDLSGHAREDIVHLERVITAPIDWVFAAWTDPSLIGDWFGPDGFSVVESQLDLRVGGQYRISIAAPDGSRICHYGEYVDVERPRRLAFTWVLDGQDCDGSRAAQATTLVSIDLEAITTQSTKLVLRHEQLPNKDAVDGHLMGWSSSLDCLERALA